jgi:hypothetical protein
MKPNKFAPLYPPPRPDSPDNIPHYPDWPYAPHADWPHGYSRRWNDTEPAHVVPYPVDCCYPGESDCICVTSADMTLWNSYSGLSGLTAFDPETLSAIYEKVEDMDDYSAVRDTYYTVSANSAIWNSAAYVPNIYENLSALYDNINLKADYSAISAYCDIGEHNDGTMGRNDLKIWSDSLKDYYYGDRAPHDMTIVGDGSFERPLRVGRDIVMGAMAVNDVIHSGGRLITVDDLSAVKKDVIENDCHIRNNTAEIARILDILGTFDETINRTVTEVHQQLDYVVDYVDNSLDNKFQLASRDEIFDKSIADPDNFYYCPYEAQNT